jgi:uncharacterized membrane protein (UPF0127 family)
MSMQMRACSTLALVALLAVGCGDEGPRARIHTAAGTIDVALEVARTPAELERGLMYRSTLADGRGMLFVFPADADRAFWMKNTLIALDLLFIAGDGRIVGIRAEATPLSTAPIAVGQPSRFVLEVPGGYAARRGIAPGDRVDLRGVALP